MPTAPKTGKKRRNLRAIKYENEVARIEKPKILEQDEAARQRRIAQEREHHKNVLALTEMAAKESEEQAERIRERISRHGATPEKLHLPQKKGERVEFGTEASRRLQEYAQQLEERRRRRDDLGKKASKIFDRIRGRGDKAPRIES